MKKSAASKLLRTIRRINFRLIFRILTKSSAGFTRRNTVKSAESYRRRACAFDPLTSAVLSLDEIQEMVTEMLEQNKDYLPWYKG